MWYRARLSTSAKLGIAVTIAVAVGFVLLAFTDKSTFSVPRVLAFLFLATLFVAVAYSIYQVSRAAPPPPGCCAVCGYDLTGNTSGRCPECGTKI